MQRVLFVCGKNRRRSPTAEQLFSTWPDVEVDSAGFGADAVTPITGELVEWADLIFVMERSHQRKLSQRFRRQLRHQRVICLGIPDDFEYMEPALVELLVAKVGRFLRR